MNPFPAGFPSELADSAFLRGSEVAWRREAALLAVQWLGEHDYAVLGTELWLLQGGQINSLPAGTSGVPEVHGSAVSHKGHEKWTSYVGRAANEASAYLQAFNPNDITEPGELYFNVTWVSEIEFGSMELK